MAASPHLRSKIKKIRGLGSAHHGASHWWWQRVTAVALVPLGGWFIVSLVSCLLSDDILEVSAWFASPLHTVLMLVLIPTAFFHAKLGLQVVIEDYVHTPFAKYTLLLMNLYTCIGMAILCVIAVLRLHFLDMGGV